MSPWDVFRIHIQPVNFTQLNLTLQCKVWSTRQLPKPSSGVLTIALKISVFHQFTVINITFEFPIPSLYY